MFFVFCSGYRVFQTFKTYDVRHPLDLNVICTSDWNLKMSATYDITKLYFLLLDVFWNYGIHHSQIHMCFCMFALQLANRKGRDIKRSIQHFCMKFVWLIGILCMLALQTLKTNHSEDESSPSCWYLGPQGVFHPNSMNMSKPKETRKHWPERWSVSMFHTTKVTNRHFFIRSRDDLIRRGWQKCDETPKIESCASWTIRKKGTVRDIVAVFKTRLVVLYKGLYYPVIQGLSRVLSFEQCSDD